MIALHKIDTVERFQFFTPTLQLLMDWVEEIEFFKSGQRRFKFKGTSIFNYLEIMNFPINYELSQLFGIL